MTGELLRSTAYFGERQRSGDRFTADALLDLYTAAPVVASVVIRGSRVSGRATTCAVT